MEGGGVSGQNNPDVLMSQFGADMSAQWAQAVVDEADRSREQIKKIPSKKPNPTQVPWQWFPWDKLS